MSISAIRLPIGMAFPGPETALASTIAVEPEEFIVPSKIMPLSAS